jgi:hypothetical protein
MALSHTTASPTFMNIPTELRIRILSLACTHEQSIMPQQLAPGSEKFSVHAGPTAPLGSGSCPALIRRDGALPPELAAFDISRTCQTARNIIQGDKLFYANNEFEFCSTQSLLDYLAVLPSDRRNAIRSIKLTYDYHGVPVAAFTMLAVCYGLEKLTLNIGGMTNFFNPGITNFSQAPGYANLIALRGLKSFKLVHGDMQWTLIDDILARFWQAWDSQDKAKSEQEILRILQKLEYNIGQFTTRPRPRNPLVSARELAIAMNQAGVRAWGDNINSILTPPGQGNAGPSSTDIQDKAEGVSQMSIPVGQHTLSETEQWNEIDRTNLAAWDM